MQIPLRKYRWRVVVIQKSIPSYRIAFFSLLQTELERRGIELVLVFGDPVGDDKYKSDEGSLDWAHYRSNRRLRIGRRELIWQPVLGLVRGADLVIVEQASRLLLNYWLLAMQRRMNFTKVALWGHGHNLRKHRASRIGEALKSASSRHAAWWFAYTQGSRDLLLQEGVLDERITVVQNSIDTTNLGRCIASVPNGVVHEYRIRWHATPGQTAIFIGALYAEKRLDFMVQSCSLVAEKVPGFRLLIAGEGPQRALAEELAATHAFVSLVGRIDGRERAILWRMADVVLMPGLVGLAITDSFAAGVPMITTAVPFHSPEVEYIENGSNGIIVDDPYDEEKFAWAVQSVLSDSQLLARLQEGCRFSAARYTNEEMVRRFVGGIESSLRENHGGVDH